MHSQSVGIPAAQQPNHRESGWPNHMSATQPGLSLVTSTTVWGMPASHNAAGTAGPMPAYPEGYRPTPAAYYRQGSMPSADPDMSNGGPHHRMHTYNPSAGPGGNPEYQPPPGALSAAAMVAAAATATATATATASMFVQQQPEHGVSGPYPTAHPSAHTHPAAGASQMTPQQMMHYHGHYPGRMPSAPTQSHMMVSREMSQHPAPGPMTHSMPAVRRPSPYSIPQQQQPVALSRRRPASTLANPVRAQYPPSAYNGHMDIPQYGPGSPGPRPGVMMMNGSAVQQPGYTGPRPPPSYYPGGPYQGGLAPNKGMVSGQAMANSQMMYQNGYVSSQQMPNSPTTMNGTHPAMYHAQNPHHSMPPYHANNVKPISQPTESEVLLTMPVRDGLILPPFRLQHNLSTSMHPFNLKESIYHMLIDKPELDLQLKCYHHEDKNCSPNWPASASVSILMNNQPLLIDRGDARQHHKPLYLKRFCVPGKNTLTIQVNNCCCSHLFTLQLVHRPAVGAILTNLVKRRMMPLELCVSKIKANFAAINSPDNDGVEQTSVKISLKCPISFRRIRLPARSADCTHIQCFDLESYLLMNAERGSWRCPVCNKDAPLDRLEIDQFMWGIIQRAPMATNDMDDINIDANAQWKSSVTSVKEEDKKGDICSKTINNSWLNVYSPSTTQIPNPGQYEQHLATSPYPTPPNSHNSQGSNSMAHYNGGMYDVQFNSPPDFTGPMSNRSDHPIIGDDKRPMLHRQTSGVDSPAAGRTPNYPVTGNNTSPGHLPSNQLPHTQIQGGPPSVGPRSQGPPSNNPGMVTGSPSVTPRSVGPPSVPPRSVGPPSVAPASVQSPSMASELPAEIADLVTENTNKMPNIDLDELDAYLGDGATGTNTRQSTTRDNFLGSPALPMPSSQTSLSGQRSSGITQEEDELLSLFAD